MNTIIGPNIIPKYLKQFPIQILINTVLPLKPPNEGFKKTIFFYGVSENAISYNFHTYKSFFICDSIEAESSRKF